MAEWLEVRTTRDGFTSLGVGRLHHECRFAGSEVNYDGSPSVAGPGSASVSGTLRRLVVQGAMFQQCADAARRAGPATVEQDARVLGRRGSQRR